MLYIADLNRDNLLKVGITHERREPARVRELRRTLREPRLEIFASAVIPMGWGTDREWEQAVLQELRQQTSCLQLSAPQHVSTEVVEAKREDAARILNKMLRKTEVDSRLSAMQLDPEREDWRFPSFVAYYYGEAASAQWCDAILRQCFLYWLRDEPIARWERLQLGYSIAEIEECF